MTLIGFSVLFFVFVLISTSNGIMFSQCGLVYELKGQGFPEHQIKDLICMMDRSSLLRTDIISGPNPDGSLNYGLFQINNFYWCNPGNVPGKDCSVACDDLLSDDITDAAACAKLILLQRGFEAWPSWVRYCKGQVLKEPNC